MLVQKHRLQEIMRTYLLYNRLNGIINIEKIYNIMMNGDL